MQVRVCGIDEDRDRRQLGDARRPPRLGLPEHHLLRDAVGLRVEADRRRELDEPVGGPLLALVHLGQQRMRLDARRIELDGPAQVRLGGRGALAMNLRQPEAHAHLVPVAGRLSDVQQALERRHGGLGVAARERDLPREEQRVGLVVGRRLRHGARPFERLLRLVDVPGAQHPEAARDPVAGVRGLGR